MLLLQRPGSRMSWSAAALVVYTFSMASEFSPNAYCVNHVSGMRCKRSLAMHRIS